MQRYAKIEGGIVANIIESDTDPDGDLGNWIQCPDNTGIGHSYDSETGEFKAPAAPEPVPELRRITPLAFRRRFTKAERAAIEWAAVDRSDAKPQERQMAAALRADLKDQEQATFIDLDDEDIAAGVQMLEQIGLLEKGRAAEIIGADIFESERI